MVRPLTVLQMVPALDGGGVERGTLEVAQALVAAGHRSLVMSNGGRLVAELEAAGSEHIAWPVHRKSPWTLRLVWPLRRLLAERGIDIVHVRSRVPGWIAWLAWRGMAATGRPHLMSTVHGLHSVNRYSRIVTCGERVIAVSDTVRDYILDNYPDVDPAVIRVIPRGVDPAAFPYGYRPDDAWLAAWQRALPQLSGQQVITLPGRLTRLKGHHDFIALIAALRREGQPVHGLVVGGEDPRRPAYANEIRQRVVSEGLGDAVTFLGHRADVREIFAVSDLVLSLSSRPESFGRTVLEALSLGRPVAGYAHGGVGEVLGRLYPHGAVTKGDQAALLARVRQLLHAAPAPPLQHPYQLSTMLAATLAVYDELTSA